MYTKVSIPKSGDGAGAATIKNPTVIVVDVQDIETEPTRSVGNTELVGDLALKAGAKAVGIYATPSSIHPTEESQGEVDARSCVKGVEFDHPGDSVAIANFAEAFMNKGIVVIVRECDGSADGRARLIGSKCNPLYLQPEYTNTNEATRRHFVAKQEQGDKFVIGTYTGALPTLADESSAESGA